MATPDLHDDKSQRRLSRGLFPGTFDPITNGHLDIVRRGRALFDEIVIAVGQNPAKRAIFTAEERCDLIRGLVDEFEPEPNAGKITVATFEGLTVDYARSIQATAILRGLRNVSDLNFEFQLALTNRAIADIETVFVMSGEAYGFTSSTLIKQIASGGNIERLHRLLPTAVINALIARKEELGGHLPWQHRDHFTET